MNTIIGLCIKQLINLKFSQCHMKNLLKKLFVCGLYYTFTSIVQAQTRLDMFVDRPIEMKMPDDYDQSQTQGVQVHSLKIKFEMLQDGLKQRTYAYSSEPIDRLYYMASFFYSLLIKVQHIHRSSTIFPVDVWDQIGRCFGHEVPHHYTQTGFSTEDQDIVIFTHQRNQNNNVVEGAGACVVQRRPLYGLFNYDYARLRIYRDNPNFHNTLIRVIHSTLHVLGFNSNFIVHMQHTQIDEIQNHLNEQTLFFVSPFLKKRLIVSEVIDVKYGNLNLSIIKTRKVKQAVRSIFECPQTEDVGAALEKVIIQGQQHLTFHWHPQIYQDQFMTYQKVDIAEIEKQMQQLRISKLSWAMLQDTGFYEYIDIFLIDNFKPRTFQTFLDQYSQNIQENIPKCQMHKHTYRLPQFQQKSHCNVYGTTMHNSYYSIGQFKTIQQKGKYKQTKCTKMTPNFRCIEILHYKDVFQWFTHYQYCPQTECISNNTIIRILFSGIWQNVCTIRQAGRNKYLNYRTNFTVHCPSDFDAFCSQKVCEDWCKKQGICIGGKCYYPQNRFQGQQKIQNLQYGFYPKHYDLTTSNYVTGKLCQQGCLDCQYPYKCKVKRKGNDNDDSYYPLCPVGYKSCQQNAKQIVPCFENYFFQNKKCYRCDSSCTHCQETYQNTQMINFCKNCQEGKFPFVQTCQSCQVQNCMFCRQKGICKKCKLNYYLVTFDNQTTACFRCLSNCGICDQYNITICLGCGQGYYLNTQSHSCKNCISFCRKCHNQSVCIQCHKGFIKAESICVRPCELPCHQCVLGYPSKCLSCVAYHAYNADNYSCQGINISSNIDCPLRFTSDALTQKCQKIYIQNCLVVGVGLTVLFGLTKNILCNICAKGFFVNQINQCQRCPQGCSRCFQLNICDVCDDGFSNPKNRDGSRNTAKCLKCSENCLQCPASPDECQFCVDSYELIAGSCHSVNQVKIEFLFAGQYTQFIRINKLQAIRDIILKLIDQKSKIQIVQVSEGSIKIVGVVSRTFQGQVEKDCLLSYNLTNKVSNAIVDLEFQLIGISLVNNIAQCNNFIPQQTTRIIYVISAISSIVIIVLFGIIVYLFRKLSMKNKIILKFEDLKSRSQYIDQTDQKIGF